MLAPQVLDDVHLGPNAFGPAASPPITISSGRWRPPPRRRCEGVRSCPELHPLPAASTTVRSEATTCVGKKFRIP